MPVDSNSLDETHLGFLKELAGDGQISIRDMSARQNDHPPDALFSRRLDIEGRIPALEACERRIEEDSISHCHQHENSGREHNVRGALSPAEPEQNEPDRQNAGREGQRHEESAYIFLSTNMGFISKHHFSPA